MASKDANSSGAQGKKKEVKEEGKKKEVKKEIGLDLSYKKEENFGEWYSEMARRQTMANNDIVNKEEQSTGGDAGGQARGNRQSGGAGGQGGPMGDQAFIQNLAQAIALGIAAVQQPASRDGDRLLDEMFKARPPLFDGTGGKDIEDWIYEMNTVFEVIGCPEDRRVALAQNQLRDVAARWWRMYKPTGVIVSWMEFIEMLRREYCPESVQKARARDFFSARPQNMPVSEIVQQYRAELSYVADLVPSERQRICHLEQRLPDDVRTYASGFHCTTLRSYEDVIVAYASVHSSQPSQKKQKTQGSRYFSKSGSMSGQSGKPTASQRM